MVLFHQLASSKLPQLYGSLRWKRSILNLRQLSHFRNPSTSTTTIIRTSPLSSQSTTARHSVEYASKERCLLSSAAELHTSPAQQHESTALAVIDNVKQVRSSPKVALLLGLGGLIPFVAAPTLMISSGAFMPSIAMYQCYYGATVLAFLGGIRWGLTLPSGSPQSPDVHNLGYSVVPQLWGWASLVAGSYMECVVVANVGIMLGLGLTGYKDMSMYGYPGWFKGLRFCLTLGAVLAMWTCLMCKIIMDDKKIPVKK